MGVVCFVQGSLVYMHHMKRPVFAKKKKQNRFMKSLNVDGFLKFDCGGLFFTSLMVTVNFNYI